MQLKLTKHALKRTKERGITLAEIISTIEKPDRVTTDQFGNKIAQKKLDSVLLRVFYKAKNKTSVIIITAYKTSKIDK